MHPQNTDLTTSEAGLALIKKWEGWYPKAYKDPVGVWTIGWGSINGEVNGDIVWPGREITKEQGEVYLINELKVKEKSIKDMVNVPLSQFQFDAIVSLVYNIGVGNFKKSTLLKLLNRGNYDGAQGQFSQWVRARDRKTGKLITLKGLVNRRKDEAALFARPDALPVPKSVIARDERTELAQPEEHDASVQAVRASPKPMGEAFKEVFKHSETFKMYMLGLSGTVATATQMIEPILKNPAALIGFSVVLLAIIGGIWIKVRDTSEGR